MTIRRDPQVPNNIFELERHEKFGDYACAYKDELTSRYENLDVIYIPYFPIDIDLAFFQSMTFPAEAKKIGTRNGLENKMFIRNGNKIEIDRNHVLVRLFPDVSLACYVHEQICSVNGQIRDAMRALFPRYLSIRQGNITWRLTETVNEGLHVDGFFGGQPTPPAVKGREQRIKLFINIDSEPRRWWTSYPLPELLKRHRHHFADGVPYDVDQLTHQISRSPWMQEIPHHEIDFPTLAAVTGEAQGIPHAIRYGRRVIVAEFLCSSKDMIVPGKHVQAALRQWLTEADIKLVSSEQYIKKLTADGLI